MQDVFNDRLSQNDLISVISENTPPVRTVLFLPTDQERSVPIYPYQIWELSERTLQRHNIID